MNVPGGRPRASSYAFLALAPLFWSMNWIAGRAFAADVPPMGMTFFRWLFAAAILAPFALRHVRRDWPVILRHRRVLVGLGVVGIGLHNALAYLGLNYTTATNGVILNSFIPVMIVALSWIVLREPARPRQVAGVAVSLAGVLAILSQGSLATIVTFRPNVGDLLVVLSMAMWSIYSIALRWRPAGLHPIAFLFAIMIVGVVAMFPPWLAESAFVRTIAWSPSVVGAIVFVALFSSVLAYLAWNRGVEELGPTVAGLFVHLMPVFGVLLAWALLDERLGWHHVAGMALILAGIAIASRRGPTRDGSG
jgi:drug/metabolite transporter (DMT)-like permease